MACRSLIPCSATLFLTSCSPAPVGRRRALTQRSVTPGSWLRPTATRMPLLRASSTHCASATARCRQDHTRGTLGLATSACSQSGAPRPVSIRGCASVSASSLLLVLFSVYDMRGEVDFSYCPVSRVQSTFLPCAAGSCMPIVAPLVSWCRFFISPKILTLYMTPTHMMMLYTFVQYLLEFPPLAQLTKARVR